MMTPDRRTFLAWAGGAAALAAAAPLAAAPRPLPRSDYDYRWIGRLTGKYRAVFDAPDVSEGDPVLRAVVWGKQYAAAFGVTHAQLSQVLVLRHYGIHLAMNDAYWARFNLGAEYKFLDAKGEPVRVNPVRAPRAEVPAPYRDLTLERFTANGGILLACDLALDAYVTPKYVAAGMSETAARAAAVQDLLPGVILQPSGIFAVSAAQDAGCRYVPVS